MEKVDSGQKAPVQSGAFAHSARQPAGVVMASETLANEPGPYDLVITAGTVVDPESGLEAARDIGINDGRIAAISTEPLTGKRTLEAGGLIVAPGFIDLHSHGVLLPGAWMQAFDGVTTSLELESGLLPIARYYDNVAEEGGRPTNYGASASWAFARIAEKEKLEPDGTLGFMQRAFSYSNWQNTLATDEELHRILARVEAGLKEGGIGIGINAGYAPGYGRREYHELARLAAQYGVPTYTHVRYLSVKEPMSSFEALEELVALAASTGAHMHVCHVNSSAARDVARCIGLLRGAQERGVPITVEAYPYGAASSSVGAVLYRGPDWLERWAVKDASSLEYDGHPLTQAKIDEMQQSEPGAPVVMHFLRPDASAEDQRLLDLSVLYPGGAIASDAMPWVSGNEMIGGDVWPLPKTAFAHPRTAGCFSRFISRFVRERKVVSLRDAITKTSLIPAQILERSVPQMRNKGRLRVGADADIVVFDLGTIKDNATYVDPARTSSGFRHVIVNGTPVIQDAVRIADARPGRPIRRPVG